MPCGPLLAAQYPRDHDRPLPALPPACWFSQPISRGAGLAVGVKSEGNARVPPLPPSQPKSSRGGGARAAPWSQLEHSHRGSERKYFPETLKHVGISKVKPFWVFPSTACSLFTADTRELSQLTSLACCTCAETRPSKRSTFTNPGRNRLRLLPPLSQSAPSSPCDHAHTFLSSSHHLHPALLICCSNLLPSAAGYITRSPVTFFLPAADQDLGGRGSCNYGPSDPGQDSNPLWPSGLACKMKRMIIIVPIWQGYIRRK